MSARKWVTVREAWERALYGPGGFYTVEAPVDHFRTSAHASPLFAQALVELVRRHDLTAVVDLGAGGGELLALVSSIAPDLPLVGIDLRARPVGLPPAIEWRHVHPSDEVDVRPRGDAARPLLVANELLDNIPCDLVELDGSGELRVVELDVTSGAQRLGPGADAATAAWVERWWPLTEPGQPAEVGLTRDEVWRAACRRNDTGVSLAIDYGHLRAARPLAATLTSYRGGRQHPATFDARHDLTAHVAADALAAAAGGEVSTQRERLRELGVTGDRPDPVRATSDPIAYLHDLARAGEAAELTGSPGLGDFCWIKTPPQVPASTRGCDDGPIKEVSP